MSTKPGMIDRFRHRQSGIAATEVALLVPLLIVMLFSFADLGGLLSTYRKVAYSANLMADLVTQNETKVTAAQIDDYVQAAGLAMRPKNIGDVRVTVYNFRKSGSITNLVWSRSNGSGASCAAPTGASVSGLMSAGNDVVVAVVCTRYKPIVIDLMGGNMMGGNLFKLREQIALRPRYSSQLACEGC